MANDKKSKKGVSPIKMSVEDAEASVNKKFGAGTIARASTSKALCVPRIETGVFAIDYATGGGIPVGRTFGIFGKKSSGKTFLALRAVAAAQTYCREHLEKMVVGKKKLYRCLECGYRGDKEGINCPDCEEADKESKLIDMGDLEMKCPVCKEYNPFITLWVDLEGAWENSWAQRVGVNCHYVYLTRAEYAEQAIDISELMLRTRKCNLLVIDTIAHLVPSVEIEESSSKAQMGVQARLVNKMLRKHGSAQNAISLDTAKRPTIIVLNQVRMKLGVMFGDNETRPGGMGQEFVTSVDVKMWPGKYEKDDDGNTLNLVTNFRVVKNKVGVPQLDGNFRIWLCDYDGHKVCDVEDMNVVLGQALKHNWFGEFDADDPEKAPKDGWKHKEAVFKSIADVFKYFSEHREEYEELRTSLFKDRLGRIASDEDSLSSPDDDDNEGDD